MTLSEVWLTTHTQKQSLISAAGLCQHHPTQCWSTIHGVHLWSTWRPGVRTKPVHGLGVRRIHSTDRDYLWGRHGVQMVSTNARAVYDHHRLFAQDADPGHALRLGPTQPIGPGSPVIQSRFQRPDDSSQISEPVTAITDRISSLTHALRWP